MGNGPVWVQVVSGVAFSVCAFMCLSFWGYYLIDKDRSGRSGRPGRTRDSKNGPPPQ